MTAQTEGTFGVTPVGRLLFGHIFQPTEQGYQGKKLDAPEYVCGIAVPKSAPELAAFFQQCNAVAQAGFPGGEWQRQDFSWKYKDGDHPDFQGREGHAGCWVIRFRTGYLFQPTVVDINHQRIIDPHMLKPGYQVRVAYSIKANGNAQKPGIYLNFNMLQLVSVDKEIVNGPAPEQVFAAPAQALPQQPGAMPAAPGLPQQPPAPPVQPDPTFLQGGQQPPAAPAQQAINPATGLPYA